MSKKMNFEEWAERESIVFTTYVHYARRSWNFCASQYESEIAELKKKLEDAILIIEDLYPSAEACQEKVRARDYLKGVKSE